MKRMSCRVAPVVPLFAAAVAKAADAPVQAPAGSSLPGLIVPLLAVAFALAALWWMLRRHGAKAGSSGPVRIVQIIAVGPRERLLVLDHDAQRVMIGVTSSSITLLAHLAPKNAAKPSTIASAAPGEAAASTFD